MAHSLAEAWHEVQQQAPLHALRNEQEYGRAITVMEELLEEVGTNEAHPLYDLLDILGMLVHDYEERCHKMPEASGREVLKYLMEEHDLSQSDLPEVGTQGVVSELLAGKRELNLRQIRVLSERFGVDPGVFL